MIKRIRFFLILVFIAIFFSCDKSSTTNVATFKGGVVTLKEVIDRYNALSFEDKKRVNTQEDFFRFARMIALEKIILDKAYQQKLDLEKDIQEEIEKAKSRVAKEILFEKNIDKKVKITEKNYQKYKKAYEVYQIVKRTDMLDQKKVLESRKLLEDIASKIDTLDSFKKYAEKYSDDVTASVGGYIGKVRLGVMEEAIDEELMKVKLNKVSNVVESSVGLHLLYVTGVEEIPLEQLLQDSKLREEIFREEKLRMEEEWFNSLLKHSGLKIYKDKITGKASPDDVVVEYKGSKIRRADIDQTVNRYRMNSFPEPTKEDLIRLAENMGVELILNDISSKKSITDTALFKKRFKREKEFILINNFIERTLLNKEISRDDLRDFYEKNKNQLFTHIDKDGRKYVQPYAEVEKFIEYKINSENRQNARYELYRKLVSDADLKIDEKVFPKFRAHIFRQK